jgi:hypothetical protein
MAFTVPALLSTAIAESKSPGTALVSKSSVPPTVQTGIKSSPRLYGWVRTGR